jgi:glycosyltransferase involved in cell wall biosynthesis
MKIGVDARSLAGQTSGIGRYLLETILSIQKLDKSLKFVLYTAPGSPDREIIQNFELRSTQLPRQVAIKFLFGRYALADKVDIFWSAQTVLPLLGRHKFKTVSTVHDLNHLLVPETMAPITRLSHQIFFESDLRKADAIVCNSYGTASRLNEITGIDCGNIARPGVSDLLKPANESDISKLKEKLSIDRPYYLSLSTSEPRKNIPLLLDTYIEIYDENPSGTPLMLLAGPKGWQDNSRYMNHPGIRHLGYLEYSDLPALYSGAEAFIFPSIYEGFGMPAAEASACGTTVIATDIPEIREAAGPYGVFIKPDKTSLKNAILGLGKTRPEPYITGTWENAARTYIQVFKSLA